MARERARFELEMELAPLLVVSATTTCRACIGRVGTMFAEAGVNIANMTVSRTRRGGKALMVSRSTRLRRPSSSSASRARASTTPGSSR
jgi:hypothetical protein